MNDNLFIATYLDEDVHVLVGELRSLRPMSLPDGCSDCSMPSPRTRCETSYSTYEREVSPISYPKLLSPPNAKKPARGIPARPLRAHLNPIPDCSQRRV